MTRDAAAALRAAFDRAFAEPPPVRPEGVVRLLALQAGGAQIAVRTAQVAAVERVPRVTGLPGAPPGFRGITAVRGRMVPLYSLASLLEAGADESEAWLLLYEQGGEILGLSFARFEGWIEATPAEFVAAGPEARDSVLVRHDGALRHLLDLPALFERCRRLAGAAP